MKSKHIAKGQVKRSDLGRNSVNSPRVADRSLRAVDFAAGQLPAGPDGPAQVLAKTKQVDGSGSGLDADLFDGRDSSAFAQVIYKTSVPWDPPALSAGTCAQQSFPLPPEVLSTDHLLVTLDGPVGSFPSGQLTGLLQAHSDSGLAVMCSNGGGNIDQPASNINVLVLR